MNNKPISLVRKNSRISIILIFLNMLLLTACAGQQSAQQLAGLEIATMLDYKQAINKTIAAEGKYYKDAAKQLTENLTKMNNKVVLKETLDRRALRYDHLWHKNPPSQHDVLVMIDTVYSDFGAANNEYENHRIKINEQYFSKIEKLSAQQDNIEKTIAALSKLYARDKFNEQKNLIRDYLVNTLSTVRGLSGNQTKENTNE